MQQEPGACCMYCADHLAISDPWEIEHAVPRSRGGGNGEENLALSCPRCNQRKGKKTPNEWRALIKADLLEALGRVAYCPLLFHHEETIEIQRSLTEIIGKLRAAPLLFHGEAYWHDPAGHESFRGFEA